MLSNQDFFEIFLSGIDDIDDLVRRLEDERDLQLARLSENENDYKNKKHSFDKIIDFIITFNGKNIKG